MSGWVKAGTPGGGAVSTEVLFRVAKEVSQRTGWDVSWRPFPDRSYRLHINGRNMYDAVPEKVGVRLQDEARDLGLDALYEADGLEWYVRRLVEEVEQEQVTSRLIDELYSNDLFPRDRQGRR